ncbi:MAG TPA: DUF389 domain-containing protein [Ilumatobacteraceae bacterium]|nr:DUF389 domain-containing protein [Ilumatobacteraceae bacterium]HRB03667.1 DUF389 domain-containing protein [Ilumatobacteraceae bacterium]
MAALVHFSLVVPADQVDSILVALIGRTGVTNVARLSGASLQPVGDVVLFDVAREASNDVLADLEALGIEAAGSVNITHSTLSLGGAVNAALDAAPGEADNTVLWAEVESVVERDRRVTPLLQAYFVVAAVIATAGVLTDSSILIVGAMVVGPEYGPIAAMSWNLQQRKWRPLAASATVGAIGSTAAVLAAFVMTLGLKWLDRIPEGFELGRQIDAGFISHPNVYSAIVASVAAVAGVLSLAFAHSSTLVGVLVSVTTIPAIAAIGVGAAVSDWDGTWGAAVQLTVNLTFLVVVGAITFGVLRWRTPHVVEVGVQR